MASNDAPRPATRRRTVLFVAVALWIVVVVAGAGSDAGDSLLGVDNLDVVWIIMFSTAVLLSIAFFIWLKPFGGEWVEPEKNKRGFGFWLLVAIVVALIMWRPDLLDSLGNEESAEESVEVVEAELEPRAEEPVAETVAQASDILLLVVGAGLIGGVWFLMRRRTADGDDDGDQTARMFEVDLAQALDQAASELDASIDPRTAVLRSYAVLETTLASHGLSRAKAETATEHLRRALRNVQIDPGPVAQLGGLYEVARFSARPISKIQQDDAADALRRAQASLASRA